MCTVTWITGQDGYQVFFNRDELRSRQAALPPRLHRADEVDYIAPIDSDAGGTWISVNQHAITLCLLNNYRASTQLTPDGRISRGLLVKQLAVAANREEVFQAINSVNLSRFQPFYLLIFSFAGAPQLLAWDGFRMQTTNNPAMPLTSSSFNSIEVVRKRMAQLRLDDRASATLLQDFHASHQPAKGPYSVCMHREDASTVSFSHISVNREKIAFRYWDGPPCSTDETSRASLDCRPSNQAIVA